MRLLFVALSAIFIVLVCCDDEPIDWIKSVPDLDFVIKQTLSTYELEDEDLPQIPSYVGIGYDALKGNPLTNKIDPGFRNAVFDFSTNDIEMTEDKLYLIPIGMKSHIRRACSFSASTTEVENTADYQSSLEVYAKINIGNDANSFSASADYKEFESSSRSSNLISTITSAQCEMYSLEMPTFSSFTLNSDFVNGALTAYNGTDTWKRFIIYFGTHFVSTCVLGGRMHVETKFEKSAYANMKETTVNVEMAAKASFDKVSGSASATLERYQNDQSTFEKTSESQTAIYIGGAPPAGGDWTEWEASVKDELAPISYTLNSIGDLFTTDYFTDVAEEDLAKMKTQYQKAIDAHCVDNGCSAPGAANYGPLAIFRTGYWPPLIAGSYFEFMRATNPEMTVRKISMKHGSWIDNIQVAIKSLKKTYTSTKFGSKAVLTGSFDVPAGEYINKIELTYDATRITSIIFTTNLETSSKLFGIKSANYKIIELKGKLVGIFGYATADYVASIGFISSEQMYDTTSLGAVLYDGTANDGIPMTLERGATINDLGVYSFNNRLSSMQAYSLIKVCSAVNFGGICDYYGPGTYSQKRIRLNNQISSIRSIDQSEIGAIVYIDRSYRGDSLYILKDESFADLSVRGWDKRISSIKLFGWVKVCTEVNYGGLCRYFSSSNGNRSYVGDLLNEKIQSIAAYDSDSLVGTFYADSSYKGSRFVMGLGESISDLAGYGFDNRISSFRLEGGAHVLLCNDKNFNGYCTYVNTGSKDSLPKSMNEKISSIMFGNSRDRDILLNNYWTMKNDARDLIGSADLSINGPISFVADRYESVNSAVRVTALNAYLAAPSGVYFSGGFTISAWVRPLDFSYFGKIRVLDFSNGQENDNVMLHIIGLQPQILVLNGAQYVVEEFFGKSIPYGQWSHIAVSLSSTRLRCFINGEIVRDRENMAMPRNLVRTKNYIGQSSFYTDSGEFAFSELDQIKLYRVPLGANDIIMEFKESKRNFLANHWPLYKNDTKDIVGNADLYNPVNIAFAHDRFGVRNSALKLTNGYYSAPKGKYFGDSGFTVTAWVKPTATTQLNARIFDFGNSGNTENVIFYISDNFSLKPAFAIMLNGAVTDKIVFTQALTLNKWTHVAVTVSATKMISYLDGQFVNEMNNYNLPKNIERTSNFIGKSNWAGDGATKANINDVKIHNYVLNANEILTEYSETVSRLKYFWMFDGDYTDIIQSATIDYITAYYVADRYANPNSAVVLNDWSLPMQNGIYFDGEFTISMWIRPILTTSQTLAKILEIGNGVANDNVVLYMAFNENILRPYISYYYDTYEVNNLRFEKALVLSEWAHIAATVSSSKISAYINGVLINEKSNLGRRLPKAILRTNTLFGSSVTGYARPKAHFDDLKIFNIALSPAQVVEEFKKK